MSNIQYVEQKIGSDTATFIILRFFAVCMVGMWCSHALAYEMQFLGLIVGKHSPKVVISSSTGEGMNGKTKVQIVRLLMCNVQISLKLLYNENIYGG
jgi:hypothetical protein